MYLLPASVILQIENAMELLIDESGFGEVVLPVAHGRMLNHIERRPVIRMLVHSCDAGPPKPGIIERRRTSG